MGLTNTRRDMPAGICLKGAACPLVIFGLNERNLELGSACPPSCAPDCRSLTANPRSASLAARLPAETHLAFGILRKSAKKHLQHQVVVTDSSRRGGVSPICTCDRVRLLELRGGVVLSHKLVLHSFLNRMESIEGVFNP